jgi:peptide/nickel transport system ATP-binding protein
LEVRGLSIRADSGATLVDDVSFTVSAGEVIGLIGESGAGKSTIGLAALGYLRSGCSVSGGEILIGGRDVLRAGDKAKRALRGEHIAYIAQSAAAAFNPSIRIGAQVTEAPVVARRMSIANARQKAGGLFEELDLPEFSHFGQKYPHEASGGQLQRAMAAMAMIGNPRILVFDEPTTALDVTTQVDVLAAFRKVLRESGCGAIYISHDIAVVSQMVDKIMVLRGGKTVETGPTANILMQPQESYTRDLVMARRRDGSAQSARSTEKTILSVRSLVAQYGAHKVLDDVTLDLAAHSITAVVGESGSGKTTLARCIVGLLAPTSGKIVFDGKPLPGLTGGRSESEVRRIQLVHQNPDVALNPRQTVMKTIGRPLEVFQGLRGAQAREGVLRLLTQTELPEDLLDRPASRLSGGQKQRVCIARALAAQPDLLVCDEVTASLDQLVADEILELLRNLCTTGGASILFISHDLGIVRRIADQVIVMKDGRIVERGMPANIFAAPQHPYTVELLSSVPEARPDWLTQVLANRHQSKRERVHDRHR